MKILVISDTHGDISKVCRVIDSLKDEITTIIHCGDIICDIELLKRLYTDITFYYVKGNNDYVQKPLNALNEQNIVLSGKRFFIAHGHTYGVNNGLERLYYKALELSADICIFGHTHMQFYQEHNNIMLLNPGSISRPRGGNKHSYAIINIEDNNIKVDLLYTD